MPDCIECLRYVKRDDPDLMSDIEGHHPLFGEQKQHVQGRVTWCESELMVREQAIGEEKGFDVYCDDGFHDLAHDRK